MPSKTGGSTPATDQRSGEQPVRIVPASWQSTPEQLGWMLEWTRGADPELWPIVADAPPELRLVAAEGEPGPSEALGGWLGRDFLQRWDVNAPGPSEYRAYLLRDFPEGVWQLPWELLLKRFEVGERRAHHRLAVVRGISEPRPEAPTRFAEQLAVLHLTGDPAGLDLGAESDSIMAAWDSLGHQVKERVRTPVREAADAERLVEFLRREQPHIIWFSGHGRVASGRTELLFADGKWVSAARLVDAIEAAGPPAPLYAVFWACDSGSDADPSDAGSALTPDLFRLLQAHDVMSVIAMQAPIGDRTSRFLARELFAQLGAGYSLTLALTRARAKLLDQLSPYGESPRGLDWAAPVLWTSSTPVSALDWGATAEARSQLLGEEGLWRSEVARIPGEASLEDAPSPQEAARAGAWAKAERTWVQGEVEDTELRVGFLRILQAIQADWPLTVLLLDAGGDASGLSLQAWAESVHSRLRPGHVRRALVEAIAGLQYGNRERRAADAWPKLCAVEGVCLAITNPPTIDASWFWRPLLGDGRSESTIILSSDPPDEEHGAWEFDSPNVSMEPDRTGEILARAPRLSRALAVLDVPVAQRYIVLAHAKDGEVRTLQEWDGGRDVLVKVRHAVAMASAVRARVLAGSTPRQRRDAHWHAAEILGHLPRNTEAARRIQQHLLLAGDYDDAAEHTAWLVRRLTSRPRQLLAAVSKLGPHQEKLPGEAAVFVARAHVALREQELAERWLGRVRAQSTFDLALVESTWALVEKARGTVESYSSALGHVENAIAYAEQDGDREAAWRYRQDKALLLQHNFRNPGGAAELYRELIGEIELLGAPQPGDDVGPILAVIKRNYSECIRQAAEQGVVVGDTDPAALLFEAEDLVRGSWAPVRAEIHYEQAKQATKEEEARRYLERCVEVSREIGHSAMEAIALNRLYWQRPDPLLNGWAEHESRLRVFQLDGWVARTLIKGRLRAARGLARIAPDRARVELERNREFFERFDIATEGERDRKRIAQTYAGLSVLAGAGEESDPWEDFLRLEWAQKWLEDQGGPSVLEIWEREVI